MFVRQIVSSTDVDYYNFEIIPEILSKNFFRKNGIFVLSFNTFSGQFHCERKGVLYYVLYYKLMTKCNVDPQ